MDIAKSTLQSWFNIVIQIFVIFGLAIVIIVIWTKIMSKTYRFFGGGMVQVRFLLNGLISVGIKKSKLKLKIWISGGRETQ